MPLERRRSRVYPDAPVSMDQVSTASSTDLKAEDSTPGPASMPSPCVGRGDQSSEDEQRDIDPWSSSMPPPPVPSETFETRLSRSTSSASRNANRLSLTLPIAPPNGTSSRPTPTSSMPPTPIGSSALNSPMDPNDYIVAIAAQERRVLELREELGRAEKELKTLQRRWATSEAYKKRPTNRNVEPLRTLASTGDTLNGYAESPAAKRSSELDRRKAILLAQSQGTPRSRRTVIRGGHTRALSLLSPTKSADDVPIHEDDDVRRSTDSHIRRLPPPSLAPPSKRATWAPRQTQPPHGVKQIAHDFKQGLWTFVEDLRQATVGDEGVSGTTNRTSEMAPRQDHDQDTIRASTSGRGRIPFSIEPDSATDSSSSASSASFNDRFLHRRNTSRAEAKTRKHFSWTPLTFDNFDDEDWSNWDSPTVKSSRWSGSTVNGDIIPAIPEKIDENEATLRRKRSRAELRSPSPHTPSKLEELPQVILNRLSLTPSNIKNTTSNFIKEWEKSLSPPDSATLDAGLQDLRNSIL
ncbi:Uu.00g093600.m01.CDS01 [Anthostomella pinea]|uniref:Uu.00g093600.m01.CDS01 n=1 Tax=Anthostomella pinea TaxID=933095 RepID=A0AAI8YI67_9PEZI|nr:Uu.00g093600.m01.CDS01 [Anthostomella pinea]